MADRDYYKILNVSRNSDSNEIKKSYRKLAMQYHPDRNKGDEKAEKKFKEISEPNLFYLANNSKLDWSKHKKL